MLDRPGGAAEEGQHAGVQGEVHSLCSWTKFENKLHGMYVLMGGSGWVGGVGE